MFHTSRPVNDLDISASFAAFSSDSGSDLLAAGHANRMTCSTLVKSRGCWFCAHYLIAMWIAFFIWRPLRVHAERPCMSGFDSVDPYTSISFRKLVHIVWRDTGGSRWNLTCTWTIDSMASSIVSTRFVVSNMVPEAMSVHNMEVTPEHQAESLLQMATEIRNST